MNIKLLSLFVALTISLSFVACKKEKADNSVNGKFQGTWIESSAKQIMLVVTTDPEGNANTPNLFLNSGDVGYPMIYKFNNAGDTIYLSTSASELNVPYKITFSGDGQSFSIKKFHTTLPNIDPVTFNRAK